MSSTFICKNCQTEQSSSNFYKHSKMASGYLSFCKQCVRDRVARHRENNLEKIQEYDRLRGRTEKRKALNRERAKTISREKRYEKTKKWRDNSPLQYKARTAVSNAVRDGRLLKPNTCSSCGKATKIHAHHEDYAKPLDVKWLCVDCHAALHRRYK